MKAEVVNSIVEAWNQVVPPGSVVLVVKDGGLTVATVTRSEAYVLGGHTAVVMVEGISGAYALDRVIPRAATRPV